MERIAWLPTGGNGLLHGILQINMENGFFKEEEKEFQRFYRASSWWVAHREHVKRLGYGVFLVCDVTLLCIALWAFADGFLMSYKAERLAVAEMVAYGQSDLNAYTLANVAKPLQIGDALVLASEGGVVDVYAPLTNPNADWWAEFSYAFRADANETEARKGFILPGQTEKPLIVFATRDLGNARVVELVLSSLVWHRVDRHATGDYAKWEADHLAFDISKPLFETTIPISGKTIGRVTFTVKNKTAYNYYHPVFVVLLKRGNAIVGVNSTTLDSLGEESREVALNWFGPLPAAGSVEVLPSINIFDISAYKPLIGETTEDTRNRVFVK